MKFLRALPPNIQGILLITTGMFLYAVMGGLAKALQGELHTFQLLFFRFGMGAAITLLIATRYGFKNIYHSQKFPWHIARAFGAMGALGCMFYAISKMPYVDVVTLINTQGLFITLFSFLFMKEHVGRPRIAAVLAGFVGVYFMAHAQTTSTISLNPYALVALASGVFVASNITIIKPLSRYDSPFKILAINNILVFCLILIPAFYFWRPIDHFGLPLLLGLCGVAAQFITIRGVRVAELAVVSPFHYAQMVFAFLIGFVFFDETPTSNSLIGITLIVGSTAYITWREYRRGKKISAIEEEVF